MIIAAIIGIITGLIIGLAKEYLTKNDNEHQKNLAELKSLIISNIFFFDFFTKKG